MTAASASPSGPTVSDVTADDFEEQVVERSYDGPVVVDFWAAWCAPCRTLGPVLEQAVAERQGAVALAKVDVDAAQELAARFGVRGIPAVKGFRNGEVVAEFVGAQPRAQVEAFLDELVPSEADQLVSRAERKPDDDAAAEELLERALELEPDHRGAALGLAARLTDRDPDRALELVRRQRPDPRAEEIAARAELTARGDDLNELRARVAADPEDGGARLDLGRALAAHGEYAEAIDELLTVVRADDERRDEARDQLLAVFRILGDDHRLVADARRRLANALF